VKGNPDVVAALDESLKYERTLADCFEQYWLYFARERIHRLRDWMLIEKEAACKRRIALMERIYRLDQVPGNERYEIEVEPLEDADGIKDVVGYFVTAVTEAIAAAKAGRDACKDADDHVSAGVLAHGQEELEDCLWRLEAKQFKIQMVGATEYLAHHMHPEQ
jgi:bacterioferritin (cytochrome b1)